MKLIAGTRGSTLALAQTDYVIKEIKKIYPDLDIEKKIIKTKGDQILDRALDKIGDKGVFVNEIEECILKGEIDFAVHSLKDLPSKITKGLSLLSFIKRSNPRDILVLNSKYKDINKEEIFTWLKNEKNIKIGTSSKRRIAQLLKINENIIPKLIRGNIDTRLYKLEMEDYDAIVIAAAGVERLGIENINYYEFKYDEIVPASGQGALGIEIKEDNYFLKEIFNKLESYETSIEVSAERAFLEEINGGCHVPVGSISQIINEKEIEIIGIFGDKDYKKLVKNKVRGNIKDSKILGKKLARILLEEYNK